jgi:hypothetical protein
MIKGAPSIFFKASRGLKQGCPLSPFIFLIISKSLRRMIKEAKASGEFRRITISERESISHILFMDGIFCLIQVDIGGHPPFPNGSKQFSGHFGNLLFLAGFNFRGHFEGLNEGFSRSRFSMIAKGMIEPPK